jgi:hypothetical protein
MFYNNLTVGTGGSITTGGFRIFVAGTLSFTGAIATGKIARNGNSATNGAAGGGGLGGSFGGGGLGGEDLDFGDEGESEAATEAGGEAEAGAEIAGGEEASAEIEAGAETEPAAVTETIKKIDRLLTERKGELSKKLDQRNKKYQSRFVDVLIESVKSDKKQIIENVKIYDKNVKVNKDIDSMINDIDKMLDE